MNSGFTTSLQTHSVFRQHSRKHFQNSKNSSSNYISGAAALQPRFFCISHLPNRFQLTSQNREKYTTVSPVINESLHRQALSAQQSIPKLHQLWLRKKQKITPVRYFRLPIIYRSRGFRPRSCYALIGNIPSGRPEQDMFSENLEILLLRGGMHMDTPDKSTLAKYLMLTYFNKYTYEKGVISKEDYLALTEKIRRKYPVPKS